MKNLELRELKELSYEESISIYGGSPFWENLGKSLGLIYGWVQNALSAGLYAIGDAVSGVVQSENGSDIAEVSPLTLFN